MIEKRLDDWEEIEGLGKDWRIEKRLGDWNL